jgi:hypothetical protein
VDIEEFYKKGMRGKIPKMRTIIDETSKEPSINLSPSISSVVLEKESGVNSNDEDRVINKTVFTTQSLRNKASKSCSNHDISDGFGTSTETLDTAIIASTSDLHDPKSSTADVRNKSENEIQQLPEETPEERKHKEEKAAEEEVSEEMKESEGTSSESKAVEVKCNKAKATDENNAKDGEIRCIEEKVDVHNEAEVEERTQM